jgi:hypothetical protein
MVVLYPKLETSYCKTSISIWKKLHRPAQVVTQDGEILRLLQNRSLLYSNSEHAEAVSWLSRAEPSPAELNWAERNHCAVSLRAGTGFLWNGLAPMGRWLLWTRQCTFEYHKSQRNFLTSWAGRFLKDPIFLRPQSRTGRTLELRVRILLRRFARLRYGWDRDPKEYLIPRT